MNNPGSEELLQALVAPESVALVGASASPDKVTARPLTFLLRHGYAGRIYPVNPARATVMDLPAYPKVSAIPDRVEHAYILLDTDAAIEALEDCAAAGVRVVSVLADGFGEAGEQGRLRQQRLTAIARESGILLIGPNSTGVAATEAGFFCTTNAAFTAGHVAKGNLAVLSQSGSLIGTLLSRGQARGAAFSALVSVGNEAVCGIGELGQLLLNHSPTEGFVLFMETIRSPDALAEFGRRAARAGKPVVAYMSSQSAEGQALAVSHTGAMTGSAEAVSAFLREIGIHQVDIFDSLVDAPRVMTRVKLAPERPRSVTAVATTGGGGAMVVDQLSMRGITIAGCSTKARASLEEQGLSLGAGKLVDVTLAGTNYDTMKKVVSTLGADPETGVLVVIIGSSAQSYPELSVKPIIDAVAEAADGAAPVVAFVLPHAPESMERLEAGGVPAFQNVESCAETISLLLSKLSASEAVAARLPADAIRLLENARSGTLDEITSAAVFESLGAVRPRQVVLLPDADIPDDFRLNFPVVAKLVSPDLAHKTEAGAVAINIADRAALVEAVAAMRRSAEAYRPGFRLKGILVQEMCVGLGEALIGITRDPLVGPIVTVAMGGVMTEIYRDTAVRRAPVTVETARGMLSEVKGFALFEGFRGRPRGDLRALAEAVAAVSRIAVSDLVLEAEINPMAIMPEGAGVVMLDALIRRA